MVRTNWPASGPFHQMAKAKPPVRRMLSVSSHELSVSWALIMKTPSRVEKRASRASSIDTRAAPGRGRAIRARPSRLISRPLPKETATTATPSTSEKQVKEMPAANQKLPI